MTRIFLYLLIFCAAFYLYVRYLEKNALFFPDKRITVTPGAAGMDYEDVYLTSADNERIHGWFIPSRPEAGTILYLHGNAGNIGDRVHKMSLFHNMGMNVFIIDYRGYGNSTGKSTEQTMYADSLLAYEYLVNERKVPPEKIVAFGASLGGAAAIDLAGKKPLGFLVIDSSFSNAVDMAHVIYPFIPSFMVNIKLENDRKIQAFKSPKLFIHSREDEVVPYHLGRKLFDAAPEPKEFLDLRGTHMNGHLEDDENYISGVEAFFRKNNLI